MLCEGSEHKTKELEKVPQPQLNQNGIDVRDKYIF